MSVSTQSSWDTIKIIGKGGSSIVYKARFTDTGQLIAVKQIDTEGLTKEQISSLKCEIDTIKELHHPNIITYYGTQQTMSKINIFLEYADRGSLRQYYRKKGPIKEHLVISFTRQILGGLQYLHEKGIAHRDIKCANCLLTLKGAVKLADFGASKRFESESLVSGLKGTPNWMAPEVIKGMTTSFGWMKADVWSLGCTLVEMLSAKIPFSEYDNPMTAMYHIANGKPPSIQGISCSDHMKSFINMCCEGDPYSRPSVVNLMNHPFLQRLTAKELMTTANTSSTIGSTSISIHPVDPPIDHVASSPLAPIATDDSLHREIDNHPNSLNAMPRQSPVKTTTALLPSDNYEEDEIVEECDNEYAQDLFNEEESIEDETELRESNENDDILDKNSHIPTSPIPFHSLDRQQFYPSITLSPIIGCTLTPSNGISRKNFPKPIRKTDEMKVVYPNLEQSMSNIHMQGQTMMNTYSLSAPSSRVTTADITSPDSSPRAVGRRLTAAFSNANKMSSSAGILLTTDNSILSDPMLQSDFEVRPTAPLSGELHRIQNKLQESVTLTSTTLNKSSSDRKILLPRSIPKDLSKSRSTTNHILMDSHQIHVLSVGTSSLRKNSAITTPNKSENVPNKPRRRVTVERSKSAGVPTDMTSLQETLHTNATRSSLPPVFKTTTSNNASCTRNMSNDRQIQSAPPVARTANLPYIPSPEKK